MHVGILNILLALGSATPLTTSYPKPLVSRYTKNVKKPPGSDKVGWCDRRAGRTNYDTCHVIEKVTGQGSSPCHKIDNGGSPEMGIWPSVDVECTMFENDNCKYRIKRDGKWIDQQTRPLKGWGWDDMTQYNWGIEGFQGDSHDHGPKSIFCWMKYNTVGLGKESNAGLGCPAGGPVC
ncbi:uncharacterized protein HMPREF1541_03750 [Cyphellophora europaea CBS 101466]|uniref:Ecp2 effector protein domain-containing protein n=1 Tax=Cyphellophora europaea (strain CBS 101466) TaxID=1220924 RepID=W2S179_CYPE1|nr:uncharacterized protein HMPREF1541_03750 [Cyphellophora europaea CBS 101466]ETN41813.1 hypothetical protein HMPREF1541_03750 [Cyphellophora europaea CBS 101466]